MNTKHEIDQLFSKKLNGLTAEPNPASWEALNVQLTNRKKPVWLWTGIAASIAILTVVGWGLLQNTSENDVLYSNLGEDAPFPQLVSNTVATIDISGIDRVMEEKEAVTNKNIVKKKNILKQVQPVENILHLASNNENKTNESVDNMIAQEETIATKELKLDNEIKASNTIIAAVQTEEVQETSLPKVTITYAQVQSQKPVVAVDSSKFSLKKMFASAKKLTKEGGLMADLRGAKDNFVQGNRRK